MKSVFLFKLDDFRINLGSILRYSSSGILGMTLALKIITTLDFIKAYNSAELNCRKSFWSNSGHFATKKIRNDWYKVLIFGC